MDLVAGVRKEGSRGGRAEFKWDDVKDSQHRENYLGHSLMAPVGRWQKNKDLSWYAKNDTSTAALSAAEARREEIRKVKEAEQDAMSEALGFGPAPKRLAGVDANETPLGKRDVERAIKETREDGDEGAGSEGAKGVGFGVFEGPGGKEGEGREVLLGEGLDGGTAEEKALRRIIEEEKARGVGKRRRSRSRQRGGEGRRDGSRERRHRRYEDGEGRARRQHHHHHHQERDQSRDRFKGRSVGWERDGERDRYRHRDDRYRERSYDRRRSQERLRSRSRDRGRERDYERRR